MSVALLERVVAKGGKKPAPGEKRQFNVRFGPGFSARIEAAATNLGLDEANLLRMIVTECLPHYEERAKRAADKRPPEHLG